MKTTIARAFAALAYRMQADARHAAMRAAMRDRVGLSPTRTGA